MRRTKRVLPAVVLATLVAVNAYLIYLLLRPQPVISGEPAGQGGVAISPTATPSPSSPDPESSPSPSSPSPSPKSSPSSKPTAEVVQAERLMLAISAREAWRATVGDCKKSGTVQRSTNGGKTWKRAVMSDLAPIVRLGLDGGGNLYAVGGTGKECSRWYTAYSSNGTMVGQSANPLDVWYVGPKDRDRVSGPGNANATPCKKAHVAGMSALDTSRALVSCTNGSIMVTSDSGASWKKADEVQGTMAVGSGAGRYWIAGTANGCDGVSVQSLTLSGSKLNRGPRGCAPASKVEGGKVAIDVSGNTVWLWAGQEVKISEDGGQSWS